MKAVGSSISRSETSALAKLFEVDGAVDYETVASLVDPKPDDGLPSKVLLFASAAKAADINVKEALLAIDKKRRGYISGEDFRRCLYDLGLPFQHKEVYAIANRFGDKNGQVQYKVPRILQAQ